MTDTDIPIDLNSSMSSLQAWQKQTIIIVTNETGVRFEIRAR